MSSVALTVRQGMVQTDQTSTARAPELGVNAQLVKVVLRGTQSTDDEHITD